MTGEQLCIIFVGIAVMVPTSGTETMFCQIVDIVLVTSPSQIFTKKLQNSLIMNVIKAEF